MISMTQNHLLLIFNQKNISKSMINKESTLSQQKEQQDSEENHSEKEQNMRSNEDIAKQQNSQQPLLFEQERQIVETKVEKRQRLQSLDIYRGLTIVGMILVDNMGPVLHPPWFLDHSDWNGVTPADLIFPAFLFIMGIAIPLAVSQKRPVKLKNITRIFALFSIGFLLNLTAKKFNFQIVRIPGIMQRLSICYAFVLGIHWITDYGAKTKKRLGVIFMFILSLLYLVYMVSFENQEIGCPASKNLEDFCNFAGYVDRTVFTANHMLKHNGVAGTDPQGLFPTINSVITTYAGYFYSLVLLKNKNNHKKTLLFWFGSSILFGLLVYPMTLLMPLNKKLWSTSFTAIVIAISGASLAIFMIVIDLLPKQYPGMRKVVDIVTSPLMWLGLNPLAIFVGMDLLAIFMILYIKIDGVSLWTQFYRHAFKSWVEDEQISASLFAIFFLILWTTIAGIMHRFKFYIRL